jgi:predicted dehydrogenase
MAGEFVVVGAGSIGQRHLRNLAALGVARLAVVDTDTERREAACAEVGGEPVEDLAAALAVGPAAVLVCTPPDRHVAIARDALAAGSYVFIEKPIASTRDAALAALVTEARRTGRVLVGYNLRFHAGLRRVRELVLADAIGRLLTARAEFGQYLPDWRPGRDYRGGYIVRRDGGGILLDASHEVDYVRWICGEVRAVYAAMGRLSALEMESEDTAVLVLRHDGGTLSEIHLDCVQRGYSRGCKLVGSEGTIEWSFRGGIRHTRDGATWTEEPIAPDVNEMYVDEMRHFLACVQGRATPLVDGDTAAAVLAVLEAAKRSASERREVAP